MGVGDLFSRPMEREAQAFPLRGRWIQKMSILGHFLKTDEVVCEAEYLLLTAATQPTPHQSACLS